VISRSVGSGAGKPEVFMFLRLIYFLFDGLDGVFLMILGLVQILLGRRTLLLLKCAVWSLMMRRIQTAGR
jgi:hypothetical protein